MPIADHTALQYGRLKMNNCQQKFLCYNQSETVVNNNNKLTMLRMILSWNFFRLATDAEKKNLKLTYAELIANNAERSVCSRVKF